MFSLQDQEQLQKLMAENPDNQILINKLLDSHQYTLSKISHEIRNPLTMISSTLQLIEKQHPEVHEYSHWSDVQNDIAFMEKLLEDLSSYNNGSHIQKKQIHTSAFLNYTALSFASAYADSPIEFTSEIDQNLSDIQGDSIKLQQLFLNLLRNALEATSYHGKIHMTASQASDHICITITDNGCGIPASLLPDIFTPFTTYKENGTGLGLAIAKSVVKAHKGSISVTSVPLEGTTFTVTLPIEKHRH